MTSIFTFIVLTILTQFGGVLLVKSPDRAGILRIMLAAWLLMGPLLLVVNFWFPFAGGGDDEAYFELAATSITSISDALDLTKFVGLMDQPGYPWLLSIMHQFTGQDLLSFKLLNLAFLVLLIPVWYHIGYDLQSSAFGRAMAVVILLLTPLWYYGVFIFKDIVIALLQSVFLMGMVGLFRQGTKRNWLVVLGTTLALIPFRSQLVLVNVSVLAGSIALMLVRRGGGKITFVTSIVALIVIATVLSIASDPDWMAMMGIYVEPRIIGTEASKESVFLYLTNPLVDRALFPIFYLFSETSGLNPQTWTDFDAAGLRGMLALPWIFVGVPFFLLGVLWLMRRTPDALKPRGLLGRIRSTRFVATPWGVVLIFIATYMAVSYTVADTTRWRLPDIPAMGCVALAGWKSVSSGTRFNILLVWITLSGSFFALFHLFRDV